MQESGLGPVGNSAFRVEAASPEALEEGTMTGVRGRARSSDTHPEKAKHPTTSAQSSSDRGSGAQRERDPVLLPAPPHVCVQGFWPSELQEVSWLSGQGPGTFRWESQSQLLPWTVLSSKGPWMPVTV